MVLGLSGGIDSALTAAIAAEALGPANVLGVLMPSPFSSRAALTTAVALAANIGIDTLTLPIEPAMRAMEATLREAFAGTARDVTEENIQARIRGNLLMALSNKRGALLLTTGNKSELAVGYCTLYGDMSGGLGVIADVPKTMVYRVSRWLNDRDGRAVIPEAVLTKAPSAELRPNQTDQDSLPPVRDARRHPAAAHRTSRTGRRHRRRRASMPATVHQRAAPGARRRVQAQAGGPRTEGDRPRVRHGMADADRRAIRSP